MRARSLPALGLALLLACAAGASAQDLAVERMDKMMQQMQRAEEQAQQALQQGWGAAAAGAQAELAALVRAAKEPLFVPAAEVGRPQQPVVAVNPKPDAEAIARAEQQLLMPMEQVVVQRQPNWVADEEAELGDMRAAVASATQGAFELLSQLMGGSSVANAAAEEEPQALVVEQIEAPLLEGGVAPGGEQGEEGEEGDSVLMVVGGGPGGMLLPMGGMPLGQLFSGMAMQAMRAMEALEAQQQAVFADMLSGAGPMMPPPPRHMHAHRGGMPCPQHMAMMGGHMPLRMHMVVGGVLPPPHGLVHGIVVEQLEVAPGALDGEAAQKLPLLPWEGPRDPAVAGAASWEAEQLAEQAQEATSALGMVLTAALTVALAVMVAGFMHSWAALQGVAADGMRLMRSPSLDQPLLLADGDVTAATAYAPRKGSMQEYTNVLLVAPPKAASRKL